MAGGARGCARLGRSGFAARVEGMGGETRQATTRSRQGIHRVLPEKRGVPMRRSLLLLAFLLVASPAGAGNSFQVVDGDGLKAGKECVRL